MKKEIKKIIVATVILALLLSGFVSMFNYFGTDVAADWEANPHHDNGGNTQLTNESGPAGGTYIGTDTLDFNVTLMSDDEVNLTTNLANFEVFVSYSVDGGAPTTSPAMTADATDGNVADGKDFGWTVNAWEIGVGFVEYYFTVDNTTQTPALVGNLTDIGGVNWTFEIQDSPPTIVPWADPTEEDKEPFVDTQVNDTLSLMTFGVEVTDIDNQGPYVPAWLYINGTTDYQMDMIEGGNPLKDGKNWTRTVNFSADNLGYDINQTGPHLLNMWFENYDWSLNDEMGDVYVWVNEMFSEIRVESSDDPYFTTDSTYTFKVNHTSNLTAVNETVNLTVNGDDLGYMDFDSPSDATYAFPNGRNLSLVDPAGINIIEGRNTLQFNNSDTTSPEYEFWVNSNPSIDHYGNPTFVANKPDTITWEGMDNDADDTLTFSLLDTNITSAYTFVQEGNLAHFHWTPTDSDVGGDWYVEVQLDDGNGTVVTNNATGITVSALDKGFYGFDVDLWGLETDLFNFSVMYRDVDNVSVNYTGIHLNNLDDGAWYNDTMMWLDDGEVNYTVSETFYYETYLPAGNYEVTLNFTNETGEAVEEIFTGPHVEYPAELELFVDHTLANTTTPFNFTVNWTDMEGDMPALLNLTVDGEDMGAFMEANTSDMDSTDGKWYYYEMTNDTVGGHTFQVYYNDSDYGEMYYPVDPSLDYVFWVNASLEAEGVFTDSDDPMGVIYDDDNVWFHANYTNADNKSADTVMCMVDDYMTGTPVGEYEMTPAEDDWAMNGTMYTTEQFMLDEGMYFVWFWANVTNSSDEIESLAGYGVMVEVSYREAHLNGTVYDIDTGEPIQGASIVLTNDTGVMVDNHEDWTDENGWYNLTEIDITDNSVFNLTVQADGYESDWAIVDLSEGDNIYDFELTLVEGKLMGYVNFSDNETGQEGVSVEVFEYGNMSNLITEDFTNATGYYETYYLAPGQYNVTYSVTTGYYEETITVDIAVGDNMQNATLEAWPTTGTLHGYVLNETGAAIVGAAVVIDGTDFETTTNATGYYKLEDLPEGTHTAIASADGYLNSSEDVEIVAMETTKQNITLEAEPVITTGTLTGYVVDVDGVGIEGAAVTIDGTDFEAETNATGYYMLEDLPEGTHTVNATATGYLYNTEEIEIVAEETTEQNITLEAVPPAVVDFTIGPFVDTEGNAIPATVTLTAMTRALLTNTTDDSGNVGLSAEEGTYNGTFDPSDADIDDFEFTVTVSEGMSDIDPADVAGWQAYVETNFEPEVTDVTFTLGPFNDDAGDPIKGATITITVNGNEYTATTDTDGMASFTIATADVVGLTGSISGTFQHDDYNDGKKVDFTFNGDDAGDGAQVPVTVSQDLEEDEDEPVDNTLMYVLIAVVVIVIIIIAAMAMRKKAPVEEGEVALGEEMAPLPEEEMLECECPNCGAPVSCLSEACVECGEEFVLDEYKCPTCGAMVTEDDMVCPECGEEFGVEEGEEVELEEEEELFEEEEPFEEEEEELFEEEEEELFEEEEPFEEEEEEELFEEEEEELFEEEEEPLEEEELFEEEEEPLEEEELFEEEEEDLEE